MDRGRVEVADALPAADCGRICAVAGQVQRDLSRCAAGYPELFPASPFDPAFFSTVALAHAFCAPWCSATDLRLTNRITLWVFALDHLIDRVASDRSTVDDVVARCVAVAGGAAPAPGDALATLLAEIRDELGTAPAFPELAGVWREELARMLASMSQEWEWKTARAAGPTGVAPGAAVPSLDAYLENAESGFSLIFVTHWIWTVGAGQAGEVAALVAAGRAVQVVTALLNDIGSYRRDVRWGDLNALLIGATRAEVEDRLASLVARSRELIRPLMTGPHRPLVVFLDRHLDFNSGFYRVTDYQADP